MLVAFRKSAHLGSDDTKTAVDEQLKNYSVERNAKAEQDKEDIQKKKTTPKK